MAARRAGERRRSRRRDRDSFEISLARLLPALVGAAASAATALAQDGGAAISGRDTREIVLLGLSLTGLGIVPFIYRGDRVPAVRRVPVHAGAGVSRDRRVRRRVVAVLPHASRPRANWSVSLDLRERHTLVTTGVYARIRHPMYTGSG